MSSTKQIFRDDPQPHFIPRWTKEVKKELRTLKPYQRKSNEEEKANIMINKIHDSTTHDEQPLDFTSYSECLVGEGNFFKGRYEDWDETKEAKKCDRCSTLAGHQALIATSSLTNLYSFKDKLYTHFEENHKKLFKRWELRRM